MRRKDVELLDGVWGTGGNKIEVEAERMQTGYPAGTWRRNGVVLMSIRRQYDDVTSVRRHLDVMSRLCTYYS